MTGLCPWRVEARVPGGHFGWSNVGNKLTRKWADERAQNLATDWPDWELRLVNNETAEVIHFERSAA